MSPVREMKMNVLMKTNRGRALWQTVVATGVGTAAVATLCSPPTSPCRVVPAPSQSAQNLQQWGIALNLHLMDNANQLPEVGSASIDSSQTKAWYNSLPEYISLPALSAVPARPAPAPR